MNVVNLHKAHHGVLNLLQKHRSSLQDILDLIKTIIYDYCVLVPTSLPSLESMVKHSALLASEFLTVVTLLYPMYKSQSQGM